MNVITKESWADKVAFVSKQTKEMMDSIRPFVRCYCQRKLKPYKAYRCLYCGEWFCEQCAEIHFGKTKKQHRLEHPIEGKTLVLGE